MSRSFQKLSSNNSFLNFDLNYENLTDQQFKINEEANVSRNKSIEFFIQLNNDFLASPEKSIRKMAYENMQSVLRMLESENYSKLTRDLKQISKESQENFYKKKNIDFLKLRKLDTLKKYETIYKSLL